MNDEPKRCKHLRRFCLECHGQVVEYKHNPKCPVFGCTIPRGIPHEHPAGVSAVMRDPVAPLNADERAELERLRADATVMRHAGINAVVIGTKMHEAFLQSEVLRQFCEEHPATYVVPADAKIHGGRKLTQALLEAGRIRRENADLGVVFNEVPAPRRSFLRTIGRIATGIVLAIGVVSILLLSAMTAGWL